MPKSAIIVLVLSLVLFIIGKTGFEYVGVNVFIILSALYVFSGISLIDFYLRKIIKSTLLRIIIHFAIFTGFSLVTAVFPLINYFTVYIIIAVVDSFVNFRKASIKKAKEEIVNETETEE